MQQGRKSHDTERLICPYFFRAAITPTSITSPFTEIALLNEKVKFKLKVLEHFLLRTMYFCKFHFMSTNKQICFNNSHLHIKLFPFIFEIISSFTFKNFILPLHVLLFDYYRCLFEINFCYITLTCSKSSYLFCDSNTSMNRQDVLLRLFADY